MKLEDLEAKLGIANMGEEEKLALVKDIQANIPALKAEQRVLEAKTQANLVVEAIKKIKEGLEARFDELNGIVDVKVRDITSGKDGLQGPKGDQGDRGFDGVNGKDGYNGKDGIDGVDGKDGVGVQDAYIDFDGSLIIKLTDGTEINVGEVVPMDVAEKIKIIGNGGGTSQSVLDSLTSLQDQINTLTGIDGTLGTMAQQDANSVAITGGTINGTTVGATTPAAGTFTTLTATGQTSLGGDASNPTFRANALSGVTRWIETNGSVAGTPQFASSSTGAAAGMNFLTRGATGFNFSTNTSIGTVQLAVSHTASAVNYVQVTGAATGGSPTISAQGSDATAALTLTSKGAANVNFQIAGTTRARVNADASVDLAISASGGIAFKALGVTNQVNYPQSSGSITGNAPVFSVQGSDTNIAQVFQSKGTGAIDLAAGSSGVNISNGGTITAVTRTAAGSGYTSAPSVAISAPTTAGGVQATATCSIATTSGSTLASGGTGYTVGDTLTVSGGAFTSAATFTVATVSAGVITGLTFVQGGFYTTFPSNPAATTGGTGSGATINLNAGVIQSTFTITNAGSGYVEQPTVTFSGGGGSGAAAYATVGSGAIIRSIGVSSAVVTNQAFTFQTPNSITSGNPVFIIRDSASHDSWYQMGPSSSQAFLIAKGNANASAYLGASGSGSVRFTTNGDSITEQMRVSHTASAVNYVQVTGAATGGNVVISAQGSDTNVNMQFQRKGSGNFQFSGSTYLGTNGANNLLFAGAATTLSPSMSAVGTDTNIDLTLTPKGTGNVRFGTYTADMTLVVQGYITIKDSGGTVRKLAVIA